ncbi:transcriptional regulator [Paractinoplanes abujensis]|uniref:DNA-binding IclR family transcriptional regulator n=1 Tax=Paractinoplanes abujensis TaxID=882441 RepID=A0A7W7CPS2_9ACTN|nr:IclR family transcriptional regulator [Actinoplanes abujensis]MBB4692477.1 DNA-binding IclR family transcriptional regulator [Actinoplanes abujensis]GID24047.1 transcriptional regulator [Actinoplanes abujensis]
MQDHPSSVLGKAFLLFSAFDGARTTLGLTDLSRRSGIPKATAYRLAQELVDLNLLERAESGYRLGWRMYELGQLVPGPANLRHVARPALMDLHSATRAAVHLAVPHGPDTLYLERLAGRRDARLHTAVGNRIPLWYAASGKLFLAHSPDLDDLVAALDREAAPRTRHSVRSAAQLRGQLAAVRERRWSAEYEECVEGYKSYAVPVTLDGPQHVVAAVSATLAVSRHDDQQVVRALWTTAAHISRSLEAVPSAA